MLEIGLAGKTEVVVTWDLTAEAIGSGSLPVFSTPSMIAQMEKAAALSVLPHLQEGEGTVGTKLEVEHMAATPTGLCVVCESRLVEIDRRRLVFELAAFCGEEQIGRGRHERFIIQNDAFMKKALAKQDGKAR